LHTKTATGAILIINGLNIKLFSATNALFFTVLRYFAII